MPTPKQIIHAAAFEAAMTMPDRARAASIYDALAEHAAQPTEQAALRSLASRQRDLLHDARQLQLTLNSGL